LLHEVSYLPKGPPRCRKDMLLITTIVITCHLITINEAIDPFNEVVVIAVFLIALTGRLVR
jgi:hypothetical protein